MKLKVSTLKTYKKFINLHLVIFFLIIPNLTFVTMSTTTEPETTISTIGNALTIFIRNEIGALNKSVVQTNYNLTYFNFESVRYEIWNPYNTSLTLTDFTLETLLGMQIDQNLQFNYYSSYRQFGCPSFACPLETKFLLQPGLNTFNNTSEVLTFYFQNKSTPLSELPAGTYFFNFKFNDAYTWVNNIKNITYSYNNQEFTDQFNLSFQYYNFNISSNGYYHIKTSEQLHRNWGDILYTIGPTLSTAKASSRLDIYVGLLLGLFCSLPIVFILKQKKIL